MSDVVSETETALMERLASLSPWNTHKDAPTAAELKAGYLVVSQASDAAGGPAETQEGREWTLVYAVKAVATSRATALALRSQADALLLADPPLTIASGGIWRFKRTGGISYEESLGGGAFATHAGHLYVINITESIGV